MSLQGVEADAGRRSRRSPRRRAGRRGSARSSGLSVSATVPSGTRSRNGPRQARAGRRRRPGTAGTCRATGRRAPPRPRTAARSRSGSPSCGTRSAVRQARPPRALRSMSPSTRGSTRSASLIARPHVGSAGHARLLRRTPLMRPTVTTPCASRTASTASRSSVADARQQEVLLRRELHVGAELRRPPRGCRCAAARRRRRRCARCRSAGRGTRRPGPARGQPRWSSTSNAGIGRGGSIGNGTRACSSCRNFSRPHSCEHVLEARVLPVRAVAEVAVHRDDGLDHVHGVLRRHEADDVGEAGERRLLVVGHAHAAAGDDVEAGQRAGLVEQRDEAGVVREDVHAVVAGKGDRGLELPGQVRRAVERVLLVGDDGLAVHPDLVVGLRLRQGRRAQLVGDALHRHVAAGRRSAPGSTSRCAPRRRRRRTS